MNVGDAVPPMQFSARVERLREQITEVGCDGLLVTKLVNIRYLTGFTGSAGVLLLTPHDCLFVTDGRYSGQAADQIGGVGIEARIEISEAEDNEILSKAAAGLKRLGLEAESVTWARARGYEKWFPEAELLPTERVIEGLRGIKDAGEVQRLRAAAAIADEAFARVRSRLAAVVT